MFFSRKHFEFKDIPDLSGKTAIVTGSNTGIGRVCALEMARKNCRVIVAARNEEKSKKAVEEIIKETGNDKVEFMKLDLLSLAAVKTFVKEFKLRYDSLHILINNAGVMMCPFGLSADGIETQFATNHVAHYYLTILLLPLLEKAAPSRVVNVSSMGHLATSLSPINFDKINDEKSYDKSLRYCQTKAANILFTRELSRRLKEKGVEVYVNCNHPGVVQSELNRHIVTPKSFLDSIYNMFTITTENGALTQLYLATSPEVETKKITGEYYVPYAKRGTSNGYTQSEKNAKELWDFTEKLLKEKIPDYPGAGI